MAKRKGQRETQEERALKMREFLALENELQKTKEEYGIEDKPTKLQLVVNKVYDIIYAREKRRVVRKKYIWLALLTGWFGGHRFYTHQYKTAVLYLLLFWSGFPIAMTIVDLMIALPMKPDEEGMILM
ncbi:MAG: TM2 domain-containing protein [bacterium]|nr:TM2 domain-containing protein [bacterium]